MHPGSSDCLPGDVVVIRFDPPADGRTDGYVLISEEDRPSVHALLDRIKNSTGCAYIVDLTGKSFCGTMRLGQILRLQQALRETGRVLRIAVDQPELMDVFRLTRLNTIMSIYSTLGEAAADARRPI